MHRNGHHSNLRVLLTGGAAGQVAEAIDAEPTVSLIEAGQSADVVLHVVASSSAPGLTEEVAEVRKASSAPLILAAYGEPNGSGKTVLSTNIAVAAARAGIETLLVDLDLQFGDAALAMGVSPRATIADLAGSS